MPEAGRVFIVDPAAADILDFDPAVDRLDFGNHSVHNLILGKTPDGEVAIINPWAWTPQFQVLRGITFQDLALANFGVVENEHLRQDIGGLLSWELGIGPRAADTVYLRSHEYGVQEVVEGFDPATMKLSFLYFGTRERLSVEDTDGGLLISVEPTGQSILFPGVAKAELIPANIEFHHDQIVEDQLEVPFGFTVEQVTMVSRVDLLTPEGPPGQVTDGHQTSPGSGHVPGGEHGGDHGGHHPDPHDPDPHDPGHDHGGPGMGGEPVPGTQIAITWAWGEVRTFADFDPAQHVLVLDWFGADQLVLAEEQGSAVLRIPDMQQAYTLAGVALAELSLANFAFKDAAQQAHIAAILAAADSVEPHHPDPDPEPHDPGHDPDPGHDHGGPGMGGEPVPGTQIAITWAWGEVRTFADFDPAQHVLALDWFGADQLVLVEEQGNAVLRIPDMQQAYTLAGVALAELSLANFAFKDAAQQAHIAAILGAADSGEPHHPEPDPDPHHPDPDPDPHHPDPDPQPGSGQAHFVTWAWNDHRVIEGFDPAADRLDFDWFAPGQFTVAEEGGSTVVRIPANQQSVTLAGLALSDLGSDNFTFRDPAAAAYLAEVLANAGDGAGTDPGPADPGPTDPGTGPEPPPAGGEGFEGFLSALGDFESGVDFARYQNGQITEAQIRHWVGDEIWEAWAAGEIEWRDMSYHSVNQLGFTGRYQFGEALLIDLGYYAADTFYGNGAATNEWTGSFSGKNGVTSYEAFKGEVQETAIREAFGYNLKVVDAMLQFGGKSLDDFLGTEIPDAGAWPAARTDVITLTGLLASAHLVGAWGTAAFLLGGTALADENGTSMLRYMAEYGGYDHPPAEDLVQTYIDSMAGYGPVIYPDVVFDAPEAPTALAFAMEAEPGESDGQDPVEQDADPHTAEETEAAYGHDHEAAA